MELSNLSSNWKNLQKQLQNEKATSNGTRNKRKRGIDVLEDLSETQKRRKPGQSEQGKSTPKQKRGKKIMSVPMPGRGRSESAPGPPAKSAQNSAIRTLRPSVSSIDLNAALASNEVNEGNSSTHVAGKYVALDCEMVGIGPNPDKTSQLARVSLVNFHGDQVYDSFVLPQLKVTDYRTPVSGITENLLVDGRSFEEVQEDIETLLRGRVLVGHAVKNDLSVLRLPHPRGMIRDTAYHKPWRERLCNGGKPSLRLLAREILGWQNFQEGAHDSVEDARAAMALFRGEKDAFEMKASGRNGEAGRGTAKAVKGQTARDTKARRKGPRTARRDEPSNQYTVEAQYA